VQPADFSANEPFHVAVESLANNGWLPDGSGRWFYERARGSYGAAVLAASSGPERSGGFTRETPKERRFSKTDLAKYLNAWDGLPHLVSHGNQKNFQHFMQSLKDEHSVGFAPDENWCKAFVAKTIMFRATQRIVKGQKFPAYQANITAYVVACLSFRFQDKIDFNTIWLRQAISPELESMIASWAVLIDKELRRTANSRMPSEWAKKIECWDLVRDAPLDVPNPLPPELHRETSGQASRDDEELDSTEDKKVEFDRNDLISGIRQIFARGGSLERDEALRKLAEQIGYRADDTRFREELSNALRTAVRRGILKNEDEHLTLGARNIADYRRGFLKDQFLASMDGHSWTERDESIRRFARWLGFRRTGPNIEDTARSVINGLIRDDKLASTGSQIRRVR
jgi:hypothetical protein